MSCVVAPRWKCGSSARGSFALTALTKVISIHTGRFERQSDIVLRQRSFGRLGARDIVELGKLAAPVEGRILRVAVQHGRHPPGEALRLPHALETARRVTVEERRRPVP